jgi:hypothetical protein
LKDLISNIRKRVDGSVPTPEGERKVKKLLIALVAVMSLALLACNTTRNAPVESGDIVANGTPVAVVTASSVGVTLIFHIVGIIDGGDFDTTINKTLVAEAKAVGGNRVQLTTAMMQPRNGIFALAGGILGFPMAMASGIAVK